MQIQYTDGLNSVPNIKSLVYGRAGTGKTRLLATGESPLIFSAENGLLSLSKIRVPYIAVRNLASLVDAYSWALKSNETKQYATYGLDSISEIAEILLKEEQRKTRDGRKAYYEMGAQLLELLRAFRDIPNKHIVFIAQQTMIRDEFTGQILQGPLLPGQSISQKIPYIFDEVWQLLAHRTPEGVFTNILKTQADATSEGKDRSGMLAMYEEANLTKVINKITQKRT